MPLIEWLHKLTHDVLLWHDGDGGSVSFVGASIHATCAHCQRPVMQDSQGNWFTFEGKP